MRILILNSLYQTPKHPRIVGGAEKSVQLLAEALAGDGHEVEVIRGIAPGTSPTVEEVNGVKVYGAPIRNIYWPFGTEVSAPYLRPLWHLIDDWGPAPALVKQRLDIFKPDVVHTNTLAGLTTRIWRMAQKRGIRVVHTLRDYYLLCPRSKYFYKGKACVRPCTDCLLLTQNRRVATALPDAVVGNSHATLNLHLEQGLFTGARTKTAIGSLQAAKGQPLPPRERPEGDPVVFGYIGRVTEEKGVGMLAEAYGRLPEGSAELVIAGETDPDIQSRLSQHADGRPIRFMGFVEPRRFYEAVDIVVAPSLWHEPLPRSVIDAIGYGRPVIGSNRGGTPEAMGKPPYGWIFDPDEDNALEAAMRHSISESALPFSTSASSQAPLKAYLDIYDA